MTYLNITCKHCSTTYKVDGSKISNKVKCFKCKKCGQLVYVKKDNELFDESKEHSHNIDQMKIDDNNFSLSIWENIQKYFVTSNELFEVIKKIIFLLLKFSVIFLIVSLFYSLIIRNYINKPWGSIIAIYLILFIFNIKDLFSILKNPKRTLLILKDRWIQLTLPFFIISLIISVLMLTSERMPVFLKKNDEFERLKYSLEKITKEFEAANEKLGKEIEERKSKCSSFNLDMNITEICLRRNTDIYRVNYLGVSECLERQRVWVYPLRVKYCVEKPYWGNGPKNVNIKKVYKCFLTYEGESDESINQLIGPY